MNAITVLILLFSLLGAVDKLLGKKLGAGGAKLGLILYKEKPANTPPT